MSDPYRSEDGEDVPRMKTRKIRLTIRLPCVVEVEVTYDEEREYGLAHSVAIASVPKPNLRDIYDGGPMVRSELDTSASLACASDNKEKEDTA